MKFKLLWYYSFDGAEFTGFFESETGSDEHGYSYTGGPFETLAEAKKDAIERCQIDITTARICIAHIRAFKKPKKG